ncbi:MAG TPA: hypothetical protein VFK94_04085, partial [Patescibacteria group bacterium]|nr:hypothetical protein [Patescibacteria group bacterium]
KINPTKETPTIVFGQIPKPALPENKTANISFVLDTVDSKLPKLPSLLPVYRFAARTPNLLDLDRSTELAREFGFSSSPRQINSDTYVFTDPGSTAQEFRIDIVSKNFNLVTTNLSDPSISKVAPSESRDQLGIIARNTLDRQSLLQPDLESGRDSVTYKKIVGSGYVNAGSPSEANAARVDIFREGVAGYEIVGPKKEESLIYVVLASNQNQKRGLIEIGYTYWNYFIDGSSTYPLQPIASAWESVKAGQATLISPETSSFQEVRIQDISIAYYQSQTHQPYMQPIYIFDGVAVPTSGAEIAVRFYLPAVDQTFFK